MIASMVMRYTWRLVSAHASDVDLTQSSGSEREVTTVAHPGAAGAGPASPVRRLVIFLLVAGAGWGLSGVFDLQGIADTQAYLYGAMALLALGLYGSTTQISLPEVRSNTRIVVLAVTVGVVAKAALITGVMYAMYAAYHEPRYLVLGVAMAQIDPLSVAALQSSSKLSERAKSILHAWSSFDDPVTTLLTIYVATLALNTLGMKGGLAGADFGSFVLHLLANLAFAAVATIVWLVFTKRARVPMLSDGARLPWSQNLVAVIVLAALVAVAAWQFLMLGLAVAGLIFRPCLGPWLDRVTRVALLLASVALGVLLVDGVAPLPGLLLGAAAFAAQIVVALILPFKLSRSDRGYLALSQQSGITAIILALLLEPSFPGTVAVVAPAILVINILHVCSTSAFTWVRKERAKRAVQFSAPETAESKAV